ncbi:peptide chain release factor N(5)-glutamine methyltransferase [Candidatus Mycosynbacter amalyticus]|uniref:peptide chain release factor N(5)-glutamine methyltransferase n=1 Tax=Candidatus Mycosynbacter amalyticus TaxID=2665156 RepID=A0A857MIZ2_9BACT|nr:peptide chain release factor N(5)-glutamine methyltransferase [Candidatus Mycosynbacter amalyticus]QHN42513.1 peptide chain release factor N(5)-glutamine methyltransferase [Candidatus Mycosynbacter amalyticus]
MTISAWLIDATKQLKDIGIESNRLDAELILAHTLRKPRTYLHAHLDEEIDERRYDIANARLDLRLERTPLAYITGHKEFYGRSFSVTPSVLVPRPESEALIEWLLELTGDEITPKKLVDVGTGSGILGITAKLERPHLDVLLTDIDAKALTVATRNAEQLGASVHTRRDNLLDTQGYQAEYIVANLPYVDEAWNDVSPELQHEPQHALYASQGGLKLIYQLLPQLERWLTPGGIALLEADPTQHATIQDAAQSYGLNGIGSHDYALGLVRD